MLSAGRSLVKGIGKGSQAGRSVQQAAHDSVYRGNGCDQQVKSSMIVNNNPICKSPSKRWRAISSKRWRNLTGRRWKGLRGWFRSELNKRLIKRNGPLRKYFKSKGYRYAHIGAENLLVPPRMLTAGRVRLTKRQIRQIKRINLGIRKALWNRFVYKNRRPSGLKVPATKSRTPVRPAPIRPGSRIRKLPRPKPRIDIMRLPKGPIIGGSRRPSTPPTRPVAPARPKARPADKQIARQKALVASVRKVYGASTSVSDAKTVLKTQSWSTLKQLKIVKHIMRAFKGLGYRRAGRSERVARRLVNKTVKNWKKSGSVATQRTPQPTPKPRPARAPAATPRPRPAQRRISAAQRNKLVAAALLVVLKPKGLATTFAEAIAFAKGQSWGTVKALQLHKPFIAALNASSALGKLRPKNSRSQMRAAKKLYQFLKRS